MVAPAETRDGVGRELACGGIVIIVMGDAALVSHVDGAAEQVVGGRRVVAIVGRDRPDVRIRILPEHVGRVGRRDRRGERSVEWRFIEVSRLLVLDRRAGTLGIDCRDGGQTGTRIVLILRCHVAGRISLPDGTIGLIIFDRADRAAGQIVLRLRDAAGVVDAVDDRSNGTHTRIVNRLRHDVVAGRVRLGCSSFQEIGDAVAARAAVAIEDVPQGAINIEEVAGRSAENVFPTVIDRRGGAGRWHRTTCGKPSRRIGRSQSDGRLSVVGQPTHTLPKRWPAHRHRTSVLCSLTRARRLTARFRASINILGVEMLEHVAKSWKFARISKFLTEAFSEAGKLRRTAR